MDQLEEKEQLWGDLRNTDLFFVCEKLIVPADLLRNRACCKQLRLFL